MVTNKNKALGEIGRMACFPKPNWEAHWKHKKDMPGRQPRIFKGFCPECTLRVVLLERGPRI